MNDLPPERPEAEPSGPDIIIGGAALLLCLPAIFGVIGSIVPTILRPERSWGAETLWERLMIDVFTWSVVLAILSPPATLLGLAVGVWAIRRVGWRTAFGKTVAGILAVAVLLSIIFVLWGSAVMSGVQAPRV